MEENKQPQNKQAVLFEALSRFQEKCPEIDLDGVVSIKTQKGGTINFKYATLPNIIKKVRPQLAKQGLSFYHKINETGCECILLHKEGGIISSGVIKTGNATHDAKQVGSNITYARRYSLNAVLGIAPEDDNDAATTQSSSKKQKPTLSSKGFDEAVGRILDGEEIVALNCALHFDLTEEQSNELIKLMATKMGKKKSE